LRALGEGRYHWRHDQVLKAIADTICSGISPQVSPTLAVRAGEKPTTTARTTFSGLLAAAQYWELNVDLGKQLNFPENAATTHRQS